LVELFLRIKIMSSQANILVQGPDNRTIAVIEIKNRQNLSRDIAMILRRNIGAFDSFPHAPYFLLLSQDVGFLWEESGQKDLVAPTVEFPMKQIMSRYLPDMNPDERLRNSELELLVLMWLNDLTWGQPETTEEPEKSLASSEFLRAVQGAACALWPKEKS